MGKIRIYTNESVSVSIAEGLKRRGVDASTVEWDWEEIEAEFKDSLS